MANILILAANPGLLVGGYGGAERSIKLAEALAGHDVTVLVLSLDNKDRSHVTNDGIKFVSVFEERNLGTTIFQTSRQKFDNNQDVSAYAYAGRLNRFKAELKKRLPFTDLVVLDHYGAASLIKDVEINVPIIYASHNCELDLATQMMPKNQLALKYVREMEQFILDKSSAVTYCSKEDIIKMNELYSSTPESFYIPNGTDERIGLIRKDNHESKHIVFIGSGHPPNVEAAKNLIDVARMMPEYNFNIIGKCGDSIDQRLVPDNYVIHGFINDKLIDLLFENSVAFVNPIESGSGTHLKIMRALSYGLPTISSPTGLRGFTKEEIDGTLLVANNNDEMIEQIKKLGNKDFYQSISDRTLKLAESYYWNGIQEEFKAVCESFVGKSEEISVPQERQSVLIYSIIRNNAEHFDRFYSQIKSVVELNKDFDFYLSIYENDSTDGTKQKLMSKDWSFVSGLSIISENIGTQLYGSVKDAQRVENLAKARNKAIEAGGFLEKVDYVLMVEGDNAYGAEDVRKLLKFGELEPNFDIVSTLSIRGNGTHYDWWATRTTPIYRAGASEVPKNFDSIAYGKFYSTSNGVCLYKAAAFKEGARHGWINESTNKFDCEMVVLCQEFHKRGHGNVYVNYQARSYN